MDETLSRKWIWNPLKAGIRFIRENPQIWMTVLIAVVIFVSFLVVANFFIRIAQDAHQTLAQERVTVMQNAVVAVMSTRELSDIELEQLLSALKDSHTSIAEMFVMERVDDKWHRTLTAGDIVQRDLTQEHYVFYYQVALIAPSTLKHPEMLSGLSGVTVFRALPGERERVLVTHHRYTASDLLIQRAIEQSLLILAVVLATIFFLLFHHARIIDYSTLYQRLKEVNELKDDFISMASHELRSPLTAIRGYTSLIQEQERLPEGVPDRLKKIDRAAETLNQLIEDILDVSRIDQGRLKLEMQPVRIADCAHEVCGLLVQKARAKGLELKCASVEEDLVVMADTVRLRQVLVNLVDNAIKYTPKGSVEISAVSEKENVVIRISDTGLGMSAEDQQGLFQKFYRVNSSDVRKQTGTGLGLWITRELVKRMGGKIAVESIKGLGTHMIVTLTRITNEVST